MDHWGNQKLLRDKWKWKQDDPKPMRCSKNGSKQEKSQINTLTLHKKQLEKETKT